MRAWVIGLLMVMSACSYQGLIERISTPAERTLAAKAAVAVRDGDAASIWSLGTPGLKAFLGADVVAKMHALAPSGTPVLDTVESRWQTVDGVTTTLKSFVYELGAGQRWAIIQIVLREVNGGMTVDGVYIQPADRSPRTANAFTFSDKGALHYFWLAAMIAALAVSITAFVLILRTRGLRFKWLWAVGALISFVTFSLNWTNGAWQILPISFLLLGAAGMEQGPLAPWIFSFAIPVVGIAFLALRGSGRLPIRQADEIHAETGTP